MKVETGSRVIRFEAIEANTGEVILVIEGEDLMRDLGMGLAPGIVVGRKPIVIVDNVRWGR